MHESISELYMCCGRSQHGRRRRKQGDQKRRAGKGDKVKNNPLFLAVLSAATSNNELEG